MSSSEYSWPAGEMTIHLLARDPLPSFDLALLKANFNPQAHCTESHHPKNRYLQKRAPELLDPSIRPGFLVHSIVLGQK